VTARLVLPADAPRDQWLAARRGGVTASEIAVILGISPYDSPFNLYYRKRGELTDDYDNTAMSLGRYLEPWIADQWAADHPEFIVRPSGLYASTERPWQLCTPDRDLYYERSDTVQHVLEIKSSGTYDGWGDDGTDVIPAYYRAQVLWQLDTLGLREAHVTCFFLSTRSRRDYVVAYDADDVQLMRKSATEFLAAVEAGTPPPIDHSPATLGALKALHPELEDETAQVPDDVAEAYRWARSALKAAKEQADQAENQLRAAMGPARAAVDTSGEKICSRSIYTVPEHTRKASTVDKLNAARSKK